MKEHVLDFSTPASTSSELMNDRSFATRSFLSADDQRDLASCLEQLGLSTDSKIALIHVRNSSHDRNLQSAERYDVSCADGEAKTFQPAVDYLKECGFQVLTVGNNRASQSGLTGVVEYHSSVVRTPFRDFILGAQASLFLGTAAGALSGVAFNFRIPALLTNYVVWSSNFTAEPFSYGQSVFLLKNTLRNGQKMSLGECLESRLPVSDSGLASRNIWVEDNSPEEILESLKFLLSLGDSEEKWQEARASAEQAAFWKVFDQHATLPRVCKNNGAVIAPGFLSKHQHWLR